MQHKLVKHQINLQFQLFQLLQTLQILSMDVSELLILAIAHNVGMEQLYQMVHVYAIHLMYQVDALIFQVVII